MGEEVVGYTAGADSSGEGHEVADPPASAGFGETNEYAEYDNLTDTFLGDEREETDESLPIERTNKTIGMLPNIDAVIAADMQPILRTVSTPDKSLLLYDLRNCLHWRCIYASVC